MSGIPKPPAVKIPNDVRFYPEKYTEYEYAWDYENKESISKTVTYEPNTLVEVYRTEIYEDDKYIGTDYEYKHYMLAVENENKRNERVRAFVNIDAEPSKAIVIPYIINSEESYKNVAMSRRQFLGRLFQAYISMRNSCSIYGIYHPWRQIPVGSYIYVTFKVPNYSGVPLTYYDYNDSFTTYKRIQGSDVSYSYYSRGADEKYAHTESDTKRGYWSCPPIICIFNITEEDKTTNENMVFCNAYINSEGKFVVQKWDNPISVGYLPPGKYLLWWCYTGSALYPNGSTSIVFDVEDIRQYDYFYYSYSSRNNRYYYVDVPVWLEYMYYHFAYETKPVTMEYKKLASFDLPGNDFVPSDGIPGYLSMFPRVFPFVNDRKEIRNTTGIIQYALYKRIVAGGNYYTHDGTIDYKEESNTHISRADKHQGSLSGKLTFLAENDLYSSTTFETMPYFYEGGRTVSFGYFKVSENVLNVSRVSSNGSLGLMTDYSCYNNNHVFCAYSGNAKLAEYDFPESSVPQTSYYIQNDSIKFSFTLPKVFNGSIDGWNGSNSTSRDVEYKPLGIPVANDLDGFIDMLAQTKEAYKSPTLLDDYVSQAVGELNVDAYNSNADLPIGSHLRVVNNMKIDIYARGLTYAHLRGIIDPTTATHLGDNYSVDTSKPFYKLVSSYDSNGNKWYDIEWNNELKDEIQPFPSCTGSVNWSGYEQHTIEACWFGNKLFRAKGFQVGPLDFVPKKD